MGRDDGGGSSAAANYDAARQEIVKRSRSSQPNAAPSKMGLTLGQGNTGSYMQAFKTTLDGGNTPEQLY